MANKKWSRVEEEYVTENYFLFTVRALTQKLNERFGNESNVFTLKGVETKLESLGLKKKGKHGLRTEQQTIKSVKNALKRMFRTL